MVDSTDERQASSLGPATRPAMRPPAGYGDRDSRAWAELKGGIDLSEPFQAQMTHAGGNGIDELGNAIGVKVSRTAGASNEVLWDKEVHKLHPNLAPMVIWELDNAKWLQARTRSQNHVLLDYVAQPFWTSDITSAPGRPFMPATTRDVRSGVAETNSKVSSVHAGVTVDRLLDCRSPRVTRNGRRLRHALEPPLNLLRLVRKVLAALHALATADLGMVHCDVAMRNIAIECEPAKLHLDPQDGEYYQVRLNWAKAKLIDFGRSLRPDQTPPAWPADPDDPSLSMRLRQLTKSCEAHRPGALADLRGIDWREDLYQWGYQLREHLWRLGVGVVRGKPGSDPVPAYLWGDPQTKHPGLIDKLLVWGGKSHLGALRRDVVHPHPALLQHLDALIESLDPAEDGADDLLFYRIDCDNIYREDFNRQRQAQHNQARLDQAELSDWKVIYGSLQAVQARQAKEAASLAARTTALAQAQASHHDAQASLAQARGDHDQSVSDLAQREQALAQQHQTLTQQQRALAQAQQAVEQSRQALAHERAAWQSQADSLAAQRRAQAAASAIATPSPPRLLPKFPGLPHGPELVELPTGSYLRGSPDDEVDRSSDEGPQRRVSIAYRLAVARYAVTFDEWDLYLSELEWDLYLSEDDWTRHHTLNYRSGRQPVVMISWREVHDHFLPWLNSKAGLSSLPVAQQLRLLTEAEWEYAARAGGTEPFSLGAANDSRLSPARANYDGNYQYAGSPKGEFREETVPVASFEPNAWGLYQMHGNVWEWTQDCYESDYRKVGVDGSAHGSMDDQTAARVVRGGSWFVNPGWLRSAYRSYYAPGDGISDVGFRLARMLSPES